jgi:hypothetical protein
MDCQYIWPGPPQLGFGSSLFPISRLMGIIFHPELIDDRDGELVLHGLGVEGTVLDAKSPCLVFIAKKDWYGE